MWILKSDELFHSFFQLGSGNCGTVTISTNEDFANMLIIDQVFRLAMVKAASSSRKASPKHRCICQLLRWLMFVILEHFKVNTREVLGLFQFLDKIGRERCSFHGAGEGKKILSVAHLVRF